MTPQPPTPTLARLPGEPLRDHLYFQHWLSTGRDRDASAARLGVTIHLLDHLSDAWQWPLRATGIGSGSGLSSTGAVFPGSWSPITPVANGDMRELVSKTPGATADIHENYGSNWLPPSYTERDKTCLAWIADLCDKSPRTRHGYATDTCRWLEHCQAEGIDYLAARRTQVAAWRDLLISGTGMPLRLPAAPTTLARIFAAVRNFYDWLVLSERTHLNPARPLPLPAVNRHAIALSRPWTDNDMRVGVLDTIDLEYRLGRMGPRDRALMELLAYNAPRVAEIASMPVRAWRNPVLSWAGKRGRVRTVTTPPSTAAAIDEWLDWRRKAFGTSYLPAGAPLFCTRNGAPLCTSHIRKIVARMCRISGWPHRSPHAWRHGLITNAVEAGIDPRDVQEQVGHAEPSTTALYVHVPPGTGSDAARTLWELDRNQHRTHPPQPGSASA